MTEMRVKALMKRDDDSRICKNKDVRRWERLLR